MLVITRRHDQGIIIQLAEGADPSTRLADVFANGPIEITLLSSGSRRVKVGIAAPPELCIRRKDQ